MYPIISIIICLFASLTLGSCNRNPPAFEQKPVDVTALEIVPKTIPLIFEYLAVAESSHAVEIRARIQGYLEDIAYHEGQIVKQDDLLFIIDPSEYDAVLQQARGALAEQEANLWEAQRSVERLKPLFEQKAASKRDLDNAIATEERAKAALIAAKGQLYQAELNLNYTALRSPVTGVASKSLFRQGALITPNSLLTTISVIDPIWVNFNVSEGHLLQYYKQVKNGTIKPPKDDEFEVQVVLADGSIFSQVGRIEFSEPSLDQSTGTMSVRAVFNNPEELIRPGQFVRVKVSGATRPNSIIVPQKAVMQGKKGLFVYVLDKDNNAKVRPIDGGDWYKDYWIIESGLEKGERIVVTGTNKVIPDTPVTPEMIQYPEEL